MKTFLLSLAFVAGSLITGCAGTIHKPTTVGNAGTAALVAYSAAGYTAGKYFALSLCATPPVYPCKTQAVNDRLLAADTAAHDAAIAADNAGNDAVAKQKAADAKKALDDALVKPEVKSQTDLVSAKNGGSP